MNTQEAVEKAAAALNKLRERRPLVCCLTNTVAANFTANVLLSLGAWPAMMEEPEEAAQLAAKAGALLVNVGTVHKRQAEAMRAAIAAANDANVPWVLDPVAADKLGYRRGLVDEFIALGPRLIRGNLGEIAALGDCGGIVTLATGAVDEVAGFKIANGVELLTQVTATGCAQGAIAAAFCAVEPDAAIAAVATSLTMAIAGELAYEKAKSPGSFQIALLDVLFALSGDDFIRRAKFV